MLPPTHLSPLDPEPPVLPSLHTQAGTATGRDRARDKDRAGQHSLAAGGVHQQRDEGGGGGADAVQGEHGVFALLFADDMI